MNDGIYELSFALLDMVKAMKEVAQAPDGKQLTVEQRNLLSVAYKNVIGARRASWRAVSSIEQRAREKDSEEKSERIAEYRKDIEKELRDICNDVLALLENHLIPKADEDESKVFYHKM